MERSIKSYKKYTPANDLWIISCFYNPNAYISKPKNFETFIEKIEVAGLNHLIVECAFGRQGFTLKKTRNILRVRTSNIMWQKERLLNIALQNLPVSCTKVAWVDCDVLFENPDWAKETSEQLNHYSVVQPFKEAIRLPKDTTYYSGKGERYHSFGYVFKRNPLLVSEGKFENHGHTGFAWASHKNILLKYGLYDVCIAGTADHIMAHTFVGDWDTDCVKRIIGSNPEFYRHYLNWSKKIFRETKAKVSYVDGTLLHLWHGDVEDRKYAERERILESFKFNPFNDIRLNSSQCWSWNHNNPSFKQWAKEYFVLRKED